MEITFDNQKELDIYVTNKILDAHREWCTNFDLIIEACIKDKDFLILAQYYTQNPDILSKIIGV
jgi:hypothetical protein